MAELVALQVADPPALWRQLGFNVAGTSCTVGSVEHRLGVEGAGVVGWVVDGLTGFDEVPTAAAATRPLPPTDPHPNGVLELDHVVVATPDLARTIAAFEAAGVGLRRTREAGPQMRQAFFKLGPVIIEVVGHPTAAEDGPATFWGLTFTVADLDATAALLGDRLRPVKTAVQAGRRIGTLDRAAGSSVPIAFMSAKGTPSPR